MPRKVTYSQVWGIKTDIFGGYYSSHHSIPTNHQRCIMSSLHAKYIHPIPTSTSLNPLQHQLRVQKYHLNLIIPKVPHLIPEIIQIRSGNLSMIYPGTKIPKNFMSLPSMSQGFTLRQETPPQIMFSIIFLTSWIIPFIFLAFSEMAMMSHMLNLFSD